MTVTIHSATVDPDGETIQVVGTIDGRIMRATGWVSATSNFYPDDTRDKDGNRTSKVKRAMTDAEKLAYFVGLISAIAPVPSRPIELPGIVPMPADAHE